MRYILLLAVTLFTIGCASQFGPMGMSAEQLAAWAKIKDQNAGCVKGVYAGVSPRSTVPSPQKTPSFRPLWTMDRGLWTGARHLLTLCI